MSNMSIDVDEKEQDIDEALSKDGMKTHKTARTDTTRATPVSVNITPTNASSTPGGATASRSLQSRTGRTSSGMASWYSGNNSGSTTSATTATNTNTITRNNSIK